MEIGVVGINHNLAPIQVREHFNMTESLRIEASNLLLSKLEEVAILSTCNRNEIYFSSENSNLPQRDIIEFYKDFFNYPQVEEYIFKKTGKEAVEHLFTVSGGLDSIVIGEDQILGQIKETLQFSMELRFSQKVLNRLFMDALSVGKKIRGNLKISEVPLSTSYIGVNLLKEKMGEFENKSALIIGAGEIGILALKYLYESNLEKIYISNRSLERVQEILREFPNLIPISYKERYEVLNDVDMLLTATAAPHSIIEYKDFIKPEKPLYIMDLGLPRDVEERVTDYDGVKIYHLDDLMDISQENLDRRKKLANDAMDFVKEDVKKFMDWLVRIKVDPYLGSINERCAEIKQDSMEYLNRKLDLDSREKKIVDKVLSYALNRFTRDLKINLKEAEGSKEEEYKEVIAKVMELEV